MDDPRHTFVRGDICDPVVVGAAGRARGHRRALRGGDTRRPVDLGGRRVHPHRRDWHLHAARSGAQGAAPRGGSSRSRPTRSTAAWPKDRARETDELRPRNPYSASKAAADRLAYSYFATYDVPVIITRASNNYGPYQFPEKIIPLFVTNAIDGLSLPLYGDGGNVRDWLHVDDHCRALRAADRARRQRRDLQRRRRQRDSQRRSDARHPGRRGPAAIARAAGEGSARDTTGDTRSTRRRLARSAGRRQVPFADGLRATIDWYRRQRVVVASDQGSRTPPSRPTTRRSTAGASASRVTPLGRVLVTGAAGFAGSHALDLLAAEDADIIGWARPGTSVPQPPPARHVAARGRHRRRRRRSRDRRTTGPTSCCTSPATRNRIDRPRRSATRCW